MKKVLSLVLVLCLMAGVSAFAGDEVLQGYVSTWDNYGLDKDPITLTTKAFCRSRLWFCE